MSKIEESLKKQSKLPKYRHASFCPICNNEGGVHGKCLGCGKEGGWNYVLGDEALQKKIKDKKEDQCNLEPMEEPELSERAKYVLKKLGPGIAKPVPAAPAPPIPGAIDPHDYTTWEVMTVTEVSNLEASLRTNSGYTEIYNTDLTFNHMDVDEVVLVIGYPRSPFLISNTDMTYHKAHLAAIGVNILDPKLLASMKRAKSMFFAELLNYSHAVRNKTLKIQL